MTGGVEPLEILSVVTSPGLYRDEVMEMDFLSIEQGLSTPRTWPALGFGDPLEHAASGHALTTPREAPGLPVRFQGRIVWARAAFDLHVADDGDGRHPFEPEAHGLATSLPTFRLERRPVCPDFEVSAVEPSRRFLGVPAFHPAPQRSPDVVVHLLEGVFTHHVAVIHGPASNERVQMVNHHCGRNGRMGFQPCPDLLQERLHLLFLGRDQEFLPSHLHMEPEKIKTRGPLHNTGLLRMERQPPFLQKGGDHGARLLNGGQAFGHHDDVISIPGTPVSFPQPFGQSIEGDICQQGAEYTSDKVAKNVVEFSTNIPRKQLRSSYGAGFLGAPLMMVKPDDISMARERGGRHGTSRTHTQNGGGDSRHV